MKIYITKYLFTRGIITVPEYLWRHVTDDVVQIGAGYSSIGGELFGPGEWHSDDMEVLGAAKGMIDDCRCRLECELAKLDALQEDIRQRLRSWSST